MESNIIQAKWSRIATTTIIGIVFGIICMLLSKYTAGIDFWPIGISYLLHHAVMGFAIGASSVKIHWAAHGAMWGALFGLFLAISCVGSTLSPWIAFIMIVVWGFLIETLATKVFKQPQ
ncbi:hypothetical protein ACFLXL_02405 [Chloroflexota bacterium]